MENKISKRNIAVLALVFIWLFWIEHGHRVRIGVEPEQVAISDSANQRMSGLVDAPIDYSPVYRTIR
jgi:hypothetical protein